MPNQCLLLQKTKTALFAMVSIFTRGSAYGIDRTGSKASKNARTGVARSGLDEGVSGLDSSRLFSVFNHSLADAVLDGASSVEKLALGHCAHEMVSTKEEVEGTGRVREAAWEREGFFDVHSSHFKPSTAAILLILTKGVLPI